MTRAFGRDINKFWNTSFPEHHYIEYEGDWIEDCCDGEGIHLSENDKFDLAEFGMLVNEDTGAEHSFASAFKRWQRQQTTASILIEVKTEDLKGAILRLKELGFKVIR